MLRAALALVMTGALVPPALAQEWWMPWSQPSYRAPSYSSPRYDEDRYGRRERPRGQALMSGGPRPSVSPASPDRISFVSSYAPGTVVIDTAGRKLYLVQSPRDALVYPISVGREGFTWTGTERISRVANWPDWHPPESMRQRQPYLPVKMTGGVYNPLGAKALYLGNTLYRIHGTDDPRTIGRATSSGCFRMTNGHVVDLSRRIGIGTTVVVVNRLSTSVARSGG
jgi:lipoprotein-anchoring transpeptidase ErfK/SrfK